MPVGYRQTAARSALFLRQPAGSLWDASEWITKIRETNCLIVNVRLGDGAGTNQEQPMSRRLIIRPEAEAEMTGAFDWYEDRFPDASFS